MLVTNEPMACAMKIECNTSDFLMNDDVNAITGIRIKRRIDGGETETIGEFAVPVAGNLHFVVRDYSAKAGKAYSYYAIPLIGSREGVGAKYDARSDFKELFIGNGEKQFSCGLNTKYTYQLHHSASYVQTYYSRYPHAIHNGNMRYATGSVTGLFLRRDARGEFIKDGAHDHKEELLEFLTDGKPKVLKTPEGHMWHVSIDGEPKEDESEYIGASTVTFAWTETGPADDSLSSAEFL